MRSVDVHGFVLLYWSEHADGEEVVRARFRGAEFTHAFSDLEDLSSFLDIVKTYRPGTDGCEQAVRPTPDQAPGT